LLEVSAFISLGMGIGMAGTIATSVLALLSCATCLANTMLLKRAIASLKTIVELPDLSILP